MFRYLSSVKLFVQQLCLQAFARQLPDSTIKIVGILIWYENFHKKNLDEDRLVKSHIFAGYLPINQCIQHLIGYTLKYQITGKSDFLRNIS